jgi:hypothetical protein
MRSHDTNFSNSSPEPRRPAPRPCRDLGDGTDGIRKLNSGAADARVPSMLAGQTSPAVSDDTPRTAPVRPGASRSRSVHVDASGERRERRHPIGRLALDDGAKAEHVLACDAWSLTAIPCHATVDANTHDDRRADHHWLVAAAPGRRLEHRTETITPAPLGDPRCRQRLTPS